FLSWAQIWQQKGRDAEIIRLLTIDPHSPNEFRCNQIVRNIDAFYDAFGVTDADALWLPEDQLVTICGRSRLPRTPRPDGGLRTIATHRSVGSHRTKGSTVVGTPPESYDAA